MCTFFNVVLLASFLVSNWFVFSKSTVPVGCILWLCFNKLSILIFLFPFRFNLASALICLCFFHFQDNASWHSLYYHLTFDVLTFFLGYFAFALKLYFWSMVDSGLLQQSRIRYSFNKECKLLLVSSLKRIQEGLINQFFFHVRHNMPVHECGQKRINCVLAHTGTNYLVATLKAWKIISP